MTDCPMSLLGGVELGMTIDRYQELTRLPINAFNGLNKPSEQPVYQCSTIWKQSERAALAQALAQAEEMRERELNYHLAPKYLEEELAYNAPLILDRKHLITMGTRMTADVALAEALSLGTPGALNDPVILTIATTLTDPTEIRVYHTGLDCQIRPSSTTISGGTLTIKIPRARLVNPDYLDDRDDPLDYYDNSFFVTSVDVKRVYYDSTTALTYGWYGLNELSLTSTDVTQSALVRIINNRLSLVSHTPANYASGVWSRANWLRCERPDYIKVRYLSGIRASMDTEMMTIRLAHTLMPNKPVNCPTVEMMWKDDHAPTKNYVPYGYMQGAMVAWLADSHAKLGSGGKFPGLR